MKKKTCVCIMGATNVGKTFVAFQLAQNFHTEILSVDSRQCFKELNIGVAKPPNDFLKKIPHYFINSHSIFNGIDLGQFLSYAKNTLEQIFQNNDIAILVGGTGLYFNALINGINEIPPIPSNIRLYIQSQIDNYGIQWLVDELKKKDKDFFLQSDTKNTYRMQRALEVFLTTNQSISSFYSPSKKTLPYQFIPIVLEIERPILYDKINQRVDAMLHSGLLNEVETLYKYKHLKALQTIAYQELFEYLDQKIKLNDAIQKIKQHTRHYAKRQITWFSKTPDAFFVSSKNPIEEVFKILQAFNL